MKAIRLSECDWVEISNSLLSKENQLRNGDFGESDDDCDVEAWANQLARIQKKIGEDGVRAIKRGVDPIRRG